MPMRARKNRERKRKERTTSRIGSFRNTANRSKKEKIPRICVQVKRQSETQDASLVVDSNVTNSLSSHSSSQLITSPSSPSATSNTAMLPPSTSVESQPEEPFSVVS